MRRRFLLALFLGCFLPLRISEAASPAEDAAATVVIYNVNDPDAKGLADFYCSARAIDPANEIGLIAPVTEEIERSEYDGFIAGVLREEFVRRGYWIVTQDALNHPLLTASKIRYAVVIRGLPLKIRECENYPGDDTKVQPAPFGSCNAASLDSELSVVGLFTTQISGVLNNPCYDKNGKTNGGSQPPPGLLFVSRLDAPSPDAVKAMISNGLKAEKEGLWGWGYIDLRSITDPGYVAGDQWIRAAGDAMRKNGIPVLSDDLPGIFQSAFPITDAAAYFGWYAENVDGPFRDAAFHFVPGAVAAHLHSASASTLHDPARGWTGPLIQHGASASVGNVYEPYLVFTTDFGIMEARLLAGHNLAESYYAAQPVLSWMSVLVGDPLYRPYAVFHDGENKNSTIWSDYRRIVLSYHGDVLKAAAALGARAREKHESLYLEALGAAQYDAGVLPSAGASFRDAAVLAKDTTIQFRLLLEQARVLEKRGKPERGAALLRQSLLRFTAVQQKGLLLDWIQRMDPIKIPTPAPRPSLLK